jgi:hypothetical protein
LPADVEYQWKRKTASTKDSSAIARANLNLLRSVHPRTDHVEVVGRGNTEEELRSRPTLEPPARPRAHLRSSPSMQGQEVGSSRRPLVNHLDMHPIDVLTSARSVVGWFIAGTYGCSPHPPLVLWGCIASPSRKGGAEANQSQWEAAVMACGKDYVSGNSQPLTKHVVTRSRTFFQLTDQSKGFFPIYFTLKQDGGTHLGTINH